MICIIPNCNKTAARRGLCHMHHRRQRKGMDMSAPQMIASPGEPLAYLLALIGHVGDECVPWPFARSKAGYGNLGGKTSAHRKMCMLAHGDPPSTAHDAAHSCGKGHLGCVNPNHVRWATKRENQLDRNRHGTTNRGWHPDHPRRANGQFEKRASQ